MSADNVIYKKRRKRQSLMAVVFVLILMIGWNFPILGFFIPLCMLLGIGIGLFRGRKWCDWYCPRGSFYDVIISRISIKKGIPALFKNMYFRISVFLCLMAIMIANLVRLWPDLFGMGVFFIIMLSITTILGIILAVMFSPRSWCSFCPIGTIVNLISRPNYAVSVNSKLCLDCKVCDTICPMEIQPYKYKSDLIETVKDKDCLKCGLCVSFCPKKALSLGSISLYGKDDKK